MLNDILLLFSLKKIEIRNCRLKSAILDFSICYHGIRSLLDRQKMLGGGREKREKRTRVPSRSGFLFSLFFLLPPPPLSTPAMQAIA